MSPATPVLIAASAIALGIISFTTVGLARQFRLRRHLKRLRTMPLEAVGRK